MVSVAVVLLPDPSRAVTATTFGPGSSRMVGVVHADVPSAAPLGPRSLAHSTCVIPASSEAVPLTTTAGVALLKVDDDGEVMVTTGNCESTMIFSTSDDEFPAESSAVTAMMFTPGSSATPPAIHVP